MIAFCALILIDICIPREFVPVTTFGALYTSPTMEAHNTQARAEQTKSGLVVNLFLSDSIVDVAQSNPGISRVCNVQICVYYRRHCSSDHACEYTYGILAREDSDAGQNPSMFRFMKLAAPDAAAFAGLTRSLTFKIGKDETSGDSDASAIAVADLAQESPDAKVSIKPLVHRGPFIPPHVSRTP